MQERDEGGEEGGEGFWVQQVWYVRIATCVGESVASLCLAVPPGSILM